VRPNPTREAEFLTITEPPMPGRSPRRWVPALLGIALFAVAAALYLGGFTRAFAVLMDALGGYHKDLPFMDIQSDLAGMECYRRGIDVYVTNPCDVLGRVYNYSPVWLLGGYLGLGTSGMFVAGVGVDLVFLASLALLPPARTWRATVAVVAATLSNSVVLAVELANADVIMFVLLLLAGLVALRPSAIRLMAYPLIVFAAMLKFYPVVAMVIALRERPVRAVVVVFVALLSLLLFAWIGWTDIMRALHMLPDELDFYMIGARSLPYGLQSLYPTVYARLPLSSGALEAILCIIAVGLAIVIARSREVTGAVAGLTEAERVFLLLGGTVVVGCFFAGQSFRYRAVFMLFVLPATTALWFGPYGRFTTRLFGITSIGVMLVMWGYYLAQPVLLLADTLPGPGAVGALIKAAFWFGRELAWWWVITVLLAGVQVVVMRSEVVQACCDRHGRWTAAKPPAQT
jgi:hypothetical protein